MQTIDKKSTTAETLADRFRDAFEERALDRFDLVCLGHDELHVSRVGGERSLPDAHVVEVAPFLDADEFG